MGRGHRCQGFFKGVAASAEIVMDVLEKADHIRLFVDEKVPRDERDSIPVIFSGDDIIWIAGYRADDRFRMSGSTKKFLRLVIVRGKF